MTSYTQVDFDPRHMDTMTEHEMVDESAAALREARARRGLATGGHSLSGNGKHSPAVNVTLPEDVKKALEDRAAQEGMSVSKYVRRILTEHLAA